MMMLTEKQSKKIRQSAKGETCTLQIAGVCNHNPDTVVYCHLPDESNGMGKKSDDVSGCYGCSECHNFLDGRLRTPELRHFSLSKGELEYYMRRAQTRTLRRLIQKGIVKI